MKKKQYSLIQICLLFILYVALAGMCVTIFRYTSFDLSEGFLAFKQSVVGIDVWRAAFYIHVFTCFVCLVAGFTQFFDPVKTKKPGLHRFIGRIYVYNILFINFPTGFVLAVYANGGLAGKIAFITLDILWAYFTLAGVLWARRGDFQQHRKFMIRSYALTLSALTLRLCKAIMANYSDWSYEAIYVFDAWAAILINLLIAEFIILTTYRPNSTLYIISRKAINNSRKYMATMIRNIQRSR